MLPIQRLKYGSFASDAQMAQNEEVAVHRRCTGRFERLIDPLHFEGVVGFRSKVAVLPEPAGDISDPSYCARWRRSSAATTTMSVEQTPLTGATPTLRK